ncbi:MarR family winged helix-turn-helix transcriptional regulator [Streptomyces sp. NPDC007901]|uniref:MarR family winged helix-turn-helix transcriptional regulator n=1 Tax=Streptomyces sp. NPDC007901 TaxID=3364785 RepID=UPI0036E10B95
MRLDDAGVPPPVMPVTERDLAGPRVAQSTASELGLHIGAPRAGLRLERERLAEGRHFAVLNQLDRAPRSQRQLIDLIGSDKASMVRLVDDLEAKGLVRRDPAPGDRRVRAVTLTEHGAMLLSQARDTARDVAAGLLTHMKPDDQEELTRLLAEFLRGQHPGS